MTGKRTWKRRDFLRTSGVVAGGSAVAGCLGDDSDENDDESDDTDATGNGDEENETEDTDAVDDADDADGVTDSEGTERDGTENDGSEEDDSSEEDDDSEEEDEEDEEPAVTVSMPPVGEVAFESVPERWAANNGSWADMGIALGQEPPEALYLARRYHTQYYDDIPGVSVDAATIDSLWDPQLAPEEFFELSEDVDVFVMDPNFLVARGDNMTTDEIERIESMGTPFFGNTIFSRDYSWHDDYEYLTLYEAFEKLSQVFDETERYAAFESLHAEFQSRLDEVVPPKGERPEVAILWPLRGGEFVPYVIDEGTSFKQWRDLGVRDAFAEAGMADSAASRETVGYETLLEVDPDVLLMRSGEYRSAEEFQNEVVAKMKDHEVGRELTAVQNGDVYRGGPLYQGPIINLVATQRAAEQLYDVDRELFDRQRVSDIVTGRF